MQAGIFTDCDMRESRANIRRFLMSWKSKSSQRL